MTDELLYERLAISIARSHSPFPHVHQAAIANINQLYPLADRPRLPARRRAARLPRGARAERVPDVVGGDPGVPPRQTRHRKPLAPVRRRRRDGHRPMDRPLLVPADRGRRVSGLRVGRARDAGLGRPAVDAERPARSCGYRARGVRPDTVLCARGRAPARHSPAGGGRAARPSCVARAPCAGCRVRRRRRRGAGPRRGRARIARNVRDHRAQQPAPARHLAVSTRPSRDRRARQWAAAVRDRRCLDRVEPPQQRVRGTGVVRVARSARGDRDRGRSCVLRPALRRRPRARALPLLRHSAAARRARRSAHRHAAASVVGGRTRSRCSLSASGTRRCRRSRS